jgi:hypothetical protein
MLRCKNTDVDKPRNLAKSVTVELLGSERCFVDRYGLLRVFLCISPFSPFFRTFRSLRFGDVAGKPGH